MGIIGIYIEFFSLLFIFYKRNYLTKYEFYFVKKRINFAKLIRCMGSIIIGSENIHIYILCWDEK